MAATVRTRSHGSKTKRSIVKEDDRSQRVLDASQFQCWTPKGQTAFKLLISARFTAALLSNISDCDETFNYWEPTHFLQYGSGFQTWEYSPVYAIRSYAYVMLHLLPAKLHAHLFHANKILVFYFVRCVLGFICALCELYFYKGVCRLFGGNIGRLTLFSLVLNTGMFISSAAFLPSSFSMYMTLLAMGAWFTDNIAISVLSIASSAILGWPFAGAIGIPIAVDFVLRRREILQFIKWCVIALLVILVPVVMVDSHFYGKLVVTPLNIVLYNVFSEHGPDLYGVEPWTYYFINGFLNFNVAFLMALVALPAALLVTFILRYRYNSDERSPIPSWLSLSPMYIWILVFFTRPHKEERFLFPIYPLFCLAGAVTMASVQKIYHLMFFGQKNKHYTTSSGWLAVVVGVVFTVLSLSRSVALFHGYHGPLDLYPELNRLADGETGVHKLPADAQVNVCVGKEWYRFPSSYFLPNDRWHLQFIASEFRGQLPKPYSNRADATQLIPSHMNDLNLEETSRYIDVNECHYLVDLDVPVVTPREPRYSQQEDNWTVVASVDFLDASRSHKLLRAFYIPFLSDQYCSRVGYNLLKNKHPRAKRKDVDDDDTW
ncbi:alpha-1,2-mannosyltransferase ALG9-like [Ptychodera flava]|uniref:alpha-1,2-mannosyltransferase ALG9-like n=1 Tax=Ptychodera flava TaxID=63121 RepID=UPI003969CFC3